MGSLVGGTRLGNGSNWKLARTLARIFTQIGLERLLYVLETLPIPDVPTSINLARYDDVLYLVPESQYIFHHLL